MSEQTALYGIKIKELCAYYASKSKLPIFVKVSTKHPVDDSD
jgi:hypothetical protein